MVGRRRRDQRGQACRDATRPRRWRYAPHPGLAGSPTAARIAAHDNVGHRLQAEPCSTAGWSAAIACRPLATPLTRSRAVPLLDLDNQGPGGGYPCTASANR